MKLIPPTADSALKEAEQIIAVLVHMLGGSVMLDSYDMNVQHELTVVTYQDPWRMRLEVRKEP